MELCWMLRGSLDGRGFDRAGRRTDTCICMAESLGCSPETFTTLFISFTPTQNNKLKKIKKDVEMFWVHSTAPIGGNYTPPAIQDCRMQLSQTSGVYHHAVAARKNHCCYFTPSPQWESGKWLVPDQWPSQEPGSKVNPDNATDFVGMRALRSEGVRRTNFKNAPSFR